MIWGDLGLFIFFGLVLAGSAILCVKSLTKISTFLRFSEFMVGFVLMGMSTTLPELFVGISSAINKTPSIALGNVIGSIIVNLTLVAGIVVILAKGIETKKGIIKKDAYRLLLMIIIPVALMVFGNGLSRLDGVILILLFFYNLYTLYKERRAYSERLSDHISRKEAVGYTFLFIISIIILFLSARGTVIFGALISNELKLPQIFIGLFFIALGTSLPELVFGIIAAKTKHAIMSLGDLIGAGIINATFVLGITALIHPIQTTFLLFLTSSIFMILVTFIFITFIQSGNKIDWREGIALVFLYIFFLIVELSISGQINFA